jgi:2-polyprenyl-6-methoxyphenol hydroxylase-like FAD-dependent oxidoreductase
MSSDPVVIVGAGPSGALLGIELARRGADVRIIEKAPAPSMESRAGGVQSRTLELFSRLGIVDELLSAGNRVRAFNYYSEFRRIMRLDFGHLDGPYPFMLQVPQYETQRVLDGCLERLGVPIERGVELVDLSDDHNGVKLTASRGDAGRQEVSASYVVGCDGAHSTVRHQLQMPFEGQPYEWDWLGADVEVDWGYPESEVQIFISTAGVLACLPFGGGRWRLLTPKVANGPDDHPRPDLDQIRALVERRGPASMMIDKPTWIGAFRASRRSAPHYRQGRVFLAGDAVHIHSPAAGQGMNTGLGDAANLGWKLGLVATGQAPESLLDTYEPERAPVAQGVIKLTHSIMQMFDSTTPWRRLRDRALPLASRSRLVQRQLASRLSQQWVSYRGGPLAPSRGSSLGLAPALQAGDRAPQVTGLRLSGEGTSLFDLISRPEHTVFVLDDDGGKSHGNLMDELAHHEGVVTVFRVVNDDAGEINRINVADRRGEFGKRYGLRPGWVCAIRPDGYVGYIGQAAGLHDYLSKCLLPRAGIRRTDRIGPIELVGAGISAPGRPGTVPLRSRQGGTASRDG